MRLIAFIAEAMQIRKILDHIGADSEPPHIAPARGPPLWEDCDVQISDGVQPEPDWDLAAQPAPDYEVDQRITQLVIERSSESTDSLRGKSASGRPGSAPTMLLNTKPW